MHFAESSSSSDFSSLSHSHDGSGQCSPKVDGIIGLAPASAPAFDSTVHRNHSRLSPAANFQCFVCGQCLNERDYQRHIAKWVLKAFNVMRGIRKKIRKNSCRGIIDVNDPVLKTFPGSLQERVEALVNYLNGHLHGGALDALSPLGSGRHLQINSIIASLSC